MRAMKDSGIKWIGEIPEEWEVCRIKNIYSERTELSETGTETLLSVSEYYGVTDRSKHTSEGDFVSRAESLIGYKKCCKDDLVSNIMLAWKGSLGTTPLDGIVSPAYCVYKPLNNIESKFYHYLFRTDLYRSIFRLYSKGIIDSRLRLYSPFFFGIKCYIPPLSEQQRIATYLDTKCGEIDELINIQEKFIEELKAYKQSVITEAVTKGLNPNAKMKDSGMEWIGEIPEGWEVRKMKTLVSFINGYAFDSASFKMEGFYPVIRIGNIVDENISYENCTYVNTNEGLEGYSIKEGDVLIAMSGATTGKVGRVKSNQQGYINQRVGIIRGNYIEGIFYILQTFGFEEYVKLSSIGSAQPNISSTEILNFTIPYPPLSIQQSIATYLDTKCSQIDSLIALKQTKIEELKSFKKSLIYEYVTGKKEVPETV